MAQLFSKKANSLMRLALGGLVGLVALFFGLLYVLDLSPLNTAVGYPIEQPVQFSHEHHVGGLGIDCRYCHQSVEHSSSAGLPSSSVCMNCHAQVWSRSPYLSKVRESYETNTPLRWRRVHDLPDFVYFNHSIHVAKGIGCESCHGRVDRMPLIAKVSTLKMKWCLDCHRDPVPHVRPREAVNLMGWQPPPGPEGRALRERLAKEYGVRRLTECYTCHR